MEAIITIGAMVATAAAIIKIHDWNAKREFEERKAAILVAAEEQIARNKYNREHPQPAKPDPGADKVVQAIVKAMRKREEEQKQLRKWQYYAKHAKKWRTRKKYQKKIREYYSKRKLTGGNWSYGSGAGLFRGIENPWPSLGTDYYYGRPSAIEMISASGFRVDTPGCRLSPLIPFESEGGKRP